VSTVVYLTKELHLDDTFGAPAWFGDTVTEIPAGYVPLTPSITVPSRTNIGNIDDYLEFSAYNPVQTTVDAHNHVTAAQVGFRVRLKQALTSEQTIDIVFVVPCIKGDARVVDLGPVNFA
jgi:hypothetical protein